MKRLPFFVYGTLLPGQPNYDLWADCIREQTPAIFKHGYLIDLGFYPMLIEGGNQAVHGMVMSIEKSEYQTVLNRLDSLEDIDHQDPQAGLYRRVERSVVLEKGLSQAAWIYIGNAQKVSGRDMIPSGDWIAHSRKTMGEMAAWWAAWRFGKSKQLRQNN